MESLESVRADNLTKATSAEGNPDARRSLLLNSGELSRCCAAHDPYDPNGPHHSNAFAVFERGVSGSNGVRAIPEHSLAHGVVVLKGHKIRHGI